MNELTNSIKEETYKQWKTYTFNHRRRNSIYQQVLFQYQRINSKFTTSIDVSALTLCPAGFDIIKFSQDNNAVFSFVIAIYGNSNAKDRVNVIFSLQHIAFHIIGDSKAAQHFRGLDDIPQHELCKIRKADVPLIFFTANGEVPCHDVIAFDISQFGITRDMYIMKDSLNVISIRRVVIDDGYNFIRKHHDRQAALILLQGKHHNSWIDNFICMLAA